MKTLLLLLLASCANPEPGVVDTDCASDTQWWRDADGDGFGDRDLSAVEGCEAPAGFVAEAGDCDDVDSDVFPGAADVCDGRDTDCDGTADGEVGWFFVDRDADGYGNPATRVETCAGRGLVADGTDCDDTNGEVHPGALEYCDDVDDDCDGVVNQLDTWHTDTDGDSYGDPAESESTCQPAAGWVLDATDCAPDDPDTHPGAEDICEDGLDADCSGGDAICG